MVRGHVESFVRNEDQISANYLKGEFGDIDLHRHLFHFSRRDRELDADLWENARPGSLAGRCVLIPNLADSIVVSVVHGMEMRTVIGRSMLITVFGNVRSNGTVSPALQSAGD